jgi:hypothetical protein
VIERFDVERGRGGRHALAIDQVGLVIDQVGLARPGSVVVEGATAWRSTRSGW